MGDKMVIIVQWKVWQSDGKGHLKPKDHAPKPFKDWERKQAESFANQLEMKDRSVVAGSVKIWQQGKMSSNYLHDYIKKF